MQYIYLVRTHKHALTNQNIYKIGKTKQEPTKRMNGYDKSSELYITIAVDDCDVRERELIELFREKFKLRDDEGSEYFEGNPKEMIEFIYAKSIENWMYIGKNVIDNKGPRTALVLKAITMAAEIKTYIGRCWLSENWHIYDKKLMADSGYNKDKFNEITKLDSYAKLKLCCDDVARIRDKHNDTEGLKKLYEWCPYFIKNGCAIYKRTADHNKNEIYKKWDVTDLANLKFKCEEYVKFYGKNNIYEMTRGKNIENPSQMDL